MHLTSKVRELTELPRHVRSVTAISYVAIGIGIIALLIAIASITRKDGHNGR